MNIDANMIPDRIKEQVIVNKDLFGNDFVSDLRPSAGGSAAKSGKLFENVVYNILVKYTAYVITKRPKFKCHFGLSREGDFEIINSYDNLDSFIPQKWKYLFKIFYCILLFFKKR